MKGSHLPAAARSRRCRGTGGGAGHEGAVGARDVRGGQVQHPAARHQEPGGPGLGAERPVAQVSVGDGEVAPALVRRKLRGLGRLQFRSQAWVAPALLAFQLLPLAEERPGEKRPGPFAQDEVAAARPGAAGRRRPWQEADSGGMAENPRLSGGAPCGSLLLLRQEGKRAVSLSPLTYPERRGARAAEPPCPPRVEEGGQRELGLPAVDAEGKERLSAGHPLAPGSHASRRSGGPAWCGRC